MNFLDKVLTALAPGWVGSLIGIVGLVAAGITYILTRQRTIIAYRTRGMQLLGSLEAKLPREVTVQYRGKDVPRLTRSLVVIWNDGERTINQADVVDSDPLVLDAGNGAEILSASVVKSSRDVIQLICRPNDHMLHQILISFAFLDSKDGGVIEVLHTGERRHLKLLGTVKGMPSGPKGLGGLLSRQLPGKPNHFVKSRRSFAGLTIVVGVVFALVGFNLAQFSDGAKLFTGLKYPLAVGGLLYVGLGAYLLWFVRRRYPRSLHVEELE